MTFSLEARVDGEKTADTADTAQQIVRDLDDLRGSTDGLVRIKIRHDNGNEPRDDISMTPSEEKILKREGRRASFEGQPAGSCPYGTADMPQRNAWLSGYNQAP